MQQQFMPNPALAMITKQEEKKASSYEDAFQMFEKKAKQDEE